LKGSYRKTAADRSTTEGKALGLGLGWGRKYFSEEEDCPNFSASSSFSFSFLGERGRGEAVPEGWDTS